MKKLFAALATVGALGACSEPELRLGGAVAGGLIAESTGASDLGVAAGVVGGYVLGGVIDKATAAGCRYTSNPVIGRLNFRNVYDGVILSCPEPRPGQKYIESIRRSPDWVFVSTQSPRNRRSRRGVGPYSPAFN